MAHELSDPDAPRVLLKPARVTVVVRVRPPDSGPAKQDIGIFPAVGGFDTIIVDRDGAEADRRCEQPLPLRFGSGLRQ